MGYLLGIDIGGTKSTVVLGWHSSKEGTDSLDVIDRLSFPTEVQKGVEYTLNKIVSSAEDILCSNRRNMKEIEGIGISCGGPLDSKAGIILSPPNLPGWDKVEIVHIVEIRFGVKPLLQNDANACALAEWCFGAARGFRNVVFLTFGTGMGAGLIFDGRLYNGTNDMAGEVGHIRLAEHGPVGHGKTGSFEGFCSGGGLAELARIKILEKLQAGEHVSFCCSAEDLSSLDAKTVAEAAFRGDPLAKEIFQICGRYLGRGLAILIDVLNPEIIVLGSIFVRAREFLWPYASEEIERESLTHSLTVCRVVPAGLGERIGDYAALSVALYGE